MVNFVPAGQDAGSIVGHMSPLGHTPPQEGTGEVPEDVISVVPSGQMQTGGRGQPSAPTPGLLSTPGAGHGGGVGITLEQATLRHTP